MSTLKVLKEYLLVDKNGEEGYLLKDENNGKIAMLSGAWGSGKTHFWKEEIVKEQKKIKENRKEKDKYTLKEYKEGLSYKLKQKKKACVYVSLYGKPSIESIELDLYMNAYKNIAGDADFISKACSVFTNLGKNLGNMAHRGSGDGFKWLENLIDGDKLKKAGEYLSDGGLVCFDDFERKSKDIDLNDLFGFISQLALEYNCKVVIILNSDAFKGKEAGIFKAVKEKTVNKFFYFNPTIEELFDSIYKNNEQYKETLSVYKSEILKSIKDTEELNARIYTQVLDNCLEWIAKGYDANALRVLVLTTINFILNHIILDYQKLTSVSSLNNMSFDDTYMYKILFNYHKIIQSMSILRNVDRDFKSIDFNYIKKEIQNELGVIKDGKAKYSEVTQNLVLKQLNENEALLSAIWKYGYQLYSMDTVDEITYKKIANFVKTGILLKEEV